jgi:hypothetical protein
MFVAPRSERIGVTFPAEQMNMTKETISLLVWCLYPSKRIRLFHLFFLQQPCPHGVSDCKPEYVREEPQKQI